VLMLVALHSAAADPPMKASKNKLTTARVVCVNARSEIGHCQLRHGHARQQSYSVLIFRRRVFQTRAQTPTWPNYKY
jgi:hypothetical protein